MIAREEREYALAPAIRVLSHFAYRSFVEEGVSSEKLVLMPLGVPVEAFSPDPKAVADRCRRILAGEPLRVLYTGALSLQKGMWDLAGILQMLPKGRFCVRLVGAVTHEVRGLLKRLQGLAEIVPHQPQHLLKEQYAWADLFLFPTLQDGFAVVLAQAAASALPILATAHCSGPELIEEGKTGWVLPIRSPERFVDRLVWADLHRRQLAGMVEEADRRRRFFRGSEDVARDLEGWIREGSPEGTPEGPGR
jgi:glycosyltransferase involved in cell wall biosynthesis